MHYIPYSCQHIEEDDIDAVVKVLRSPFLTQGPAIAEFEQAVAKASGAPHAVAVSSATAGLHLTCLALGVGKGDIVWTSPLSFVASANCALYAGATIDFVDIDPQTGNMSVVSLTQKLEVAKAAGKLPKLIIPVHFAGRACDMTAIGKLKNQYGFSIVEDAAHALGAQYADGSPIGSFADSDAVVFSFHPVKPVTTGEGGVVVTRDAALAEKVRLLRSHGITREAQLPEKQNPPAWYYEQQQLGFHYRLTDIQAVLGVSQMTKLSKLIAARRALAARYRALLEGAATLPPADAQCGWHLYVVQVKPEKRDAIFAKMREKNIGVNVHYIPIHLQPYYRALGFKAGQFPAAEAYFAGALSLPLYPRLSHDDQDFVANTLRELL